MNTKMMRRHFQKIFFTGTIKQAETLTLVLCISLDSWFFINTDALTDMLPTVRTCRPTDFKTYLDLKKISLTRRSSLQKVYPPLNDWNWTVDEGETTDESSRHFNKSKVSFQSNYLREILTSIIPCNDFEFSRQKWSACSKGGNV